MQFVGFDVFGVVFCCSWLAAICLGAPTDLGCLISCEEESDANMCSCISSVNEARICFPICYVSIIEQVQ